MKDNLSARKIIANGTTSHTALCMRVRKIRIDNALTQESFAITLSTTRVNINQIERGLHAPSIETIRLIRKNFNVSYDWLLDGK